MVQSPENPTAPEESFDKKGAERRTVPRVMESATVVVSILSAPQVKDLEGRAFCCRTADLSATGLRLSVPCQVPVGTAMRMVIAFSDPLRSFKQRGMVMWAREAQSDRYPFAIGVNFTDMSPAEISEWRTVVGMKLAQPGAAV